MLLIKIFLLVVFTLQTHSERDPNWARGGPWGPPAPGNMYWDSKNTLGNDRGGGGGGGGTGVGGGLIGVVDGPSAGGGGGGGWDGPGQGGQPGCSRCTVLHDAGGPPLTDGGFGNSAAGPPGGGGPSSIPQYPPGYRGNGYDNFSPEWKLREVLQQQGAGTAPLGQVAAGGWKKDHGGGLGGPGGGSGGGSWSGTIRPIEPNYRRPNSFPWPPSSSPSGPWGPDTIPSGWGSRGPGPRKLDETFRVSSGVIGGGGGGPPAGGAGGNWVAGASGYKGGPMGGPPGGGGGGGGGYQGGGHGGYDQYGGNKVQGQSLNVHSGFRPWAQQPGFSGGGGGGGGGGGYGGGGYGGGGCQPTPPTEPPPMRGGQPSGGCGPPGVPGMEGWGSGVGHATNWDHGRPVEPRPMEPYAPREPNINNPSNTDERWMTRGPSWGFRDPPFGAGSREPGFNPNNQNWNKVAGPSLTVSSGYPEPPARPPQKDQSWGGGSGYGSSASPWPSRGPPPQKYPASFGQKDQSFGGSARRPGFGCRDLGCGGAPAQQPWAATQGAGGGGGWAASGPTAPSSNRQPPYWGDKQPPPGAPSGFKPGYGGQGQGGYPAQDQGGGYMQQGYPAQSQSYPAQGYPAQGPPQAYPPQGTYPSGGGGYDTPQNGASGYQSGPGASGYQQAGGGAPGAGGYQGGPGASGYQGGPGASGYQQAGGGGPGASGYQGGPGASGYQQAGGGGPGASGYQGGPGASGYQGGPGASGYQGGPGASSYQGGPGASGYQSGPGASGYPPSSEYEGPPRKYNGHSGVGATLDFPGLQAYAHDTSNHGSYSHCSNKTSSNDQHSASSTVSPTSTNAP